VTTFWWLVLAGSALCLGWFLGRWRGAVTYLVGGTDGRANWSRVTALTGNLCWLMIVILVLARLDPNTANASAVLWPLAAGTGALLGINLGQYVTNTVKEMKASNGAPPAVPARDSGLQPAPPIQ
jgi:hypothetical protein